MIESVKLVADDVQLSAAEHVAPLGGEGGVIPCSRFNKSSFQLNANTASGCTITIEESNDGVRFEPTGASLQNTDGNRFTTTTVRSNYQRARVTSGTTLSSKAVISARFWAEV